MIAAGGPSCTDSRDHWPLHAALVSLGECSVGSSAFPLLAAAPDPDVGLRVQGVTVALWTLIGAGLLRPVERPGGADLVVDEDALPKARRVLMRLSGPDRAAVYAAADLWARASTSRKNRASASASSGAARRSSDLNCRQSSAPALRQRADSSVSPL